MLIKLFYWKFFYSRLGYDSRILRFSARLVSDNPVDHTRVFVVCYYLADDTISVYELVFENSGIINNSIAVQNIKINK